MVRAAVVIFEETGKVHYVNETKTGQRIGVNVRKKVIHFDCTNDEVFKVGDVMIVSVRRAPAPTEEMPIVNND